MSKLYIVKAHRKWNRYEYFSGFHKNTPIISLERDKAKPCTLTEANEIIELLSGPYSKYEKEPIN